MGSEAVSSGTESELDVAVGDGQLLPPCCIDGGSDGDVAIATASIDGTPYSFAMDVTGLPDEWRNRVQYVLNQMAASLGPDFHNLSDE